MKNIETLDEDVMYSDLPNADDARNGTHDSKLLKIDTDMRSIINSINYAIASCEQRTMVFFDHNICIDVISEKLKARGYNIPYYGMSFGPNGGNKVFYRIDISWGEQKELPKKDGWFNKIFGKFISFILEDEF